MTRAAFAKAADVNASIVTRLLQPRPPKVRSKTIDALLAALPPDLRSTAASEATPKDPHRRRRVFVSSTYLDQAERRKHVCRAIENLGLEPVSMDRFAATSKTILDNELEELHRSDLYLGILAFRYGDVVIGHDRSHTEIEYDAAGEAGLDRLVFVIDRHAVQMNVEVDTDPGPDKWKLQDRLHSFERRVRREVAVAQFDSDADLVNQVWLALSRWVREQGGEVEVGHRASESTPSTETASRYRDAMLAEHRLLPMVGFASTVRAPITTTTLYVDLQARRGGYPRGDHDGGDLGPEELAGRAGGTETALDMRRAFAAAAKQRRRCLTLLGYPGSGKTTFLKRLAVACVQEGGVGFSLPADALPVLVTLRRLDKADLPRDLAYWIALSLPAHFMPPANQTAEQFANWLLAQTDQPLLLLCDGLDEVPDRESRVAVTKRVREFLAGTTQPRYAAVTSRIASYDDAIREELEGDALELELQPFSSERTEEFIANWYTIVESAFDPTTGPAEGRKKAADLIGRLRQPKVQASRVAEFTANPLLLTIVCIVHRDANQLPEKRERLYHEMMQVLLEKWRAAKEMTLQIEAAPALKLLRPIARFLHDEPGRTRAEVDELVPILEPELPRSGWKRGAAQFLQTIRDDSGLLTGQSGGSYGFLHLGIQEYLTALAIEHELIFAGGRLERLAEVLAETASHYGESWWREVLLLLLALPDRPFFAQLFEHVVERPAFGEHQELLDQCIAEAAEPDAEPFVGFLLRSAEARPKPGLRRRQLAAVRAVKRLAPKRLQEVAPAFVDSTDPERDRELRAMLGMSERDETRPRPEARSREASGLELVEIPGRGFWLARTPVTNAQYRAFMDATGHDAPSRWSNQRFNGDDQPVVGVSWHDAQAFCKWARLRLPSEEEWEFACRAGTTTEYWSGDKEADLARVGWYTKNSEGSTRPVGLKPANPFGLADMHGNVWEWCENEIRSGSGLRVVRGGSRYDHAGNCRSASRSGSLPDDRYDIVGFRPASSSP